MKIHKTILKSCCNERCDTLRQRRNIDFVLDTEADPRLFKSEWIFIMRKHELTINMASGEIRPDVIENERPN